MKLIDTREKAEKLYNILEQIQYIVELKISMREKFNTFSYHEIESIIENVILYNNIEHTYRKIYKDLIYLLD